LVAIRWRFLRRREEGWYRYDNCPRPDQAQLDKYGIRGTSVWSHPDGNELAEITKLIEVGKIKPIVSEVIPLSDAVKASKQAETHHTRGKLVLKIAEEPKS
jgi:NADPH:quinone reductase-like Zn-dependent oxidoreductase